MVKNQRMAKTLEIKMQRLTIPRTRKLTTAKMKKQMIPKIQRKNLQMSLQTQSLQMNPTAQTRQQLMRKMQKL